MHAHEAFDDQRLTAEIQVVSSDPQAGVRDGFRRLGERAEPTGNEDSSCAHRVTNRFR